MQRNAKFYAEKRRRALREQTNWRRRWRRNEVERELILPKGSGELAKILFPYVQEIYEAQPGVLIDSNYGSFFKIPEKLYQDLPERARKMVFKKVVQPKYERLEYRGRHPETREAIYDTITEPEQVYYVLKPEVRFEEVVKVHVHGVDSEAESEFSYNLEKLRQETDGNPWGRIRDRAYDERRRKAELDHKRHIEEGLKHVVYRESWDDYEDDDSLDIFSQQREEAEAYELWNRLKEVKGDGNLVEDISVEDVLLSGL